MFYFCIVGVYSLHKKTGATAPRSVFYLPIKNNINIINMTNFAIIKSTCTPPTHSKINFKPFFSTLQYNYYKNNLLVPHFRYSRSVCRLVLVCRLCFLFLPFFTPLFLVFFCSSGVPLCRLCLRPLVSCSSVLLVLFSLFPLVFT